MVTKGCVCWLLNVDGHRESGKGTEKDGVIGLSLHTSPLPSWMVNSRVRTEVLFVTPHIFVTSVLSTKDSSVGV